MTRGKMARSIAIGRVGLVAVVSMAGLVATAAPAGAAKVTAVGTVTCSYGTTMTFNPPLQPGIGTPVSRGGSELITLAPATIGTCIGSVTSGAVPTSGTNTESITFKVKANVFNRNFYAGGCLFFSSVQLLIKHTTINWAATTGALKPSKVAPGIAGLGSNSAGNLGFALSGSVKGSFAGAAALNLFFDAPSTSALQGCLSGSGTVSLLTIDATQSSIALG